MQNKCKNYLLGVQNITKTYVISYITFRQLLQALCAHRHLKCTKSADYNVYAS